MSVQEEKLNRYTCAGLIQKAAFLLKSTHVTVYTAQVCMHRFYYRKPMQQFKLVVRARYVRSSGFATPFSNAFELLLALARINSDHNYSPLFSSRSLRDFLPLSLSSPVSSMLRLHLSISH